jgi:hypothetical protein
VRASPILLLATLAALAPAQGLRLVDRIEAPMLYVSLEAGPDAGTAGAGASGIRGAATTAKGRQTPGPVHQLLADPAFDALFGGGEQGVDGAGSTGNASTGDHATTNAAPASRALALVRGVLARSSGDLELVLTGVVPSAGQPLLVLRARLHQEDRERLQGVLDGPELAEPHRVLGGQRTWALRANERGVVAGPGELVELALVGDDLLVANDTTAMEELLAPVDQRTSASAGRLVLSADPRFSSLRKRMQVPAGSLLVYGDWLRLGQRLQAVTQRSSGLGGSGLGGSGPGGSGLPSFLLEWSGVGSARSVMASLSGVGGDFTGTLLLDFDTPERAAQGRPMPSRPERGGRHEGPDRRDGGRPAGEREPRGGEPSAIDGWLAAAQSVPARALLPELPGGGLGGLVLAVDLEDIAQRSRRGSGMLHMLRDSFDDYGLDFDRNVMSRLGTRGTVQLLFQRGDDVATEVVSVYSVRAKSKKAAADLFQDLRRAAEQGGFGKLVTNKDRKGPDVLSLTSRMGDDVVCVATYEDSVLVAFDDETLVQVHDEYKRVARQRGKRDAAISSAVQAIGGENVAGLFDLDLAPLFERIEAAFHSSAQSETSPRIDLSRIPKRHIGYLDLQPRDGGMVLQIRVLSSQ